jgi:hypothetical protein
MRITVILALLIVLTASTRAATVHVAPSGDDRGPGSAEKPFTTLHRARDEARRLGAGTTVILHRGTYVLASSLELGPADSSTTWQAADGEEVRISGGPVLPAEALTPVTDEKVLSRLPDTARVNVRQAHLPDLKLPEFPDTFRGAPAAPELFFNDDRMTLARWPNEGWATIASIVEAGSVPRYGDQSNRPGVFAYDADAPNRWNVEAGVWLQGYWCYDWYDETIRIKSIDLEKRQITLAAPALYSIRQGNPSPRRFRAINVFEELDAPGEYFIDRGGMLYFWPPAAGGRIALSTLDGPLLKIVDASDVTIRGITFEACLGSGIEMTGGRNNTIDRCIVRNTRQLGIIVKGGTQHRVSGSDIHHTGTGGLHLEGGDRKTLTPAKHLATDNHIHDFSIHQQTAAYALVLGGVGNRAAHNLIENAPHQAVLINGNDHVFELNIVRNVVTETDDAGAVYKGRNPSCRGNVIRHNFFADIGSPMGHGSGAVYFDDGDGGDLVFGNVFLRCGHPGNGAFGTIFSHGGHGIRAENNIFIDCKRPLGSAPWNDQLWKETIEGGHDCGYTEKLLHEVNITQPPYTTRYPELIGFMTPQPNAPRHNHAKNNVFIRPAADTTGNWQVAENEVFITTNEPGFVDATKGDYRLRPDSEVFTRLRGFQPIPFDRIGRTRPRQR